MTSAPLRLFLRAATGLFALVLALGPASMAMAANPSGDLRIEVITAYNLVVDSNVETPATYAPRSAYFGATFHNDGDNPMTNVFVYIGNYDGGVNPTPGVYPSRAHPPLVGPLPGDEFALTHEGGSFGAGDAIRFMGVIPPGDSVTAYWLVSYPNLDENGDAVWGPSIKPDDDLWLEFDVWAEVMDDGVPVTANERRRVTMRNELSAMANKISPNTANKVPDVYKELLNQFQPVWTNVASDGSPGSAVFTEGIWYDFGTVNQGFDNNVDLVPDYNAWMQPVGDPAIFDPSCFRLVRTYALVVVKRGAGDPDLVITTENQLYFENLPPDNTGAIGYVGYEFMPLRSGCTATLSPYQEVASGFDNEKFNGDFGATLGGLVSIPSSVIMDKTVNLALAQPGTNLTYTVAFTNDGIASVGNADQGVPLVVSDSIPSNTTYVAGSAAVSNTLPVGVTAYNIFYSTNNGLSWGAAEPVPATNVTDIQWWLDAPLATGAWGRVTFEVTIASPYPTNAPPLIYNLAGLSFGSTEPFLTDDATTLLLGNNSLSGTVFLDTGTSGGVFGNGIQDGLEAGISNVLVSLYADLNANGLYDAGDVLYASTNSAANGDYSFTSLPDGYYVVQVDVLDADLPQGHTPTTVTLYAAALDPTGADVNPVEVNELDFGFAPALVLTKTGPATLIEGGLATYTIVTSNRFAGNGTTNGSPVTYVAWATNENATYTGSAPKNFTNPQNAYSPAYPDGIYASRAVDGAADEIAVDGFTVPNPVGTITNVVMVLPVNLDVAPPDANDDVVFNVYTNGTLAFTANRLINTITSATNLEYNVTSAISTNWSLFGGSNLVVEVQVNKNSGGATGAQFLLDQVGFRIETDAFVPITNGSTTLDPVPLWDYYDADILQFVSATSTVTSADLGGPAPNEGRLHWSNIGPIYPGGAVTNTVTFRVLEPPGNLPTTTTNTATITNAFYLNGLPANNATSQAVSAISPAGSIGDFVWRDLNADGVQDGGFETGIAGVSIVLTPPAGVDLGQGAGNPITNVTDASGYYLFDGLPTSGNYTVTVLTTTLPGGAGTNTYDEDDGTSSPNSETVVALVVDAASPGDNHLTADFGYQNLSSIISGTIWNDVDQSGTPTRDLGEPWHTNVTVQLVDSNNVVVATTNTSSSGYFEFLGPYSGAYTVRVSTNTGTMATGTWTQSYDSDGLGSANEVSVTLPLGGSGTADYSYYQAGTYSIGDTVFYDWNGNGAQDGGDEGITNATVRLYRDLNTNGVYDAATDPIVATDVTDINGQYLFENLPDGDYIVIVDHGSPGFPTSYAITADPQGAMDGRSAVTLAGASNLDQDFGYQPAGSGSIGDTVWRDRNGDGLQAGPLETGISNITVVLYADFNGDSTYEPIATNVTDSSGLYLFSGLADGDYRVVVDEADADLPLDAFGDPWYPTTATFYDVTISGGSTYLDADFGFASLGAIGDTIFWDANRNGTQDAAEGGISNVTVLLYQDVDMDGVFSTGDFLLDSAVTDTNGNYLFTGLLPEFYVVVVDETTVPGGAVLSADPESDGVPCDDPLAVGCDGETGVELLIAQNFMGADFGYVPPGGVIGDLLWVDFNGNDQWDPGESGIPYVTVRLYDSVNNLIATTETDADGYYLFYGLDDDTYRVVVETADPDFPAGLTQTFDPDGTLDSEGMEIVVSGGAVASIGGDACTNCNLNVDFGYRYVGTNLLSGTIGLDGDPNDGLMNGLNPSGVASNEIAFAGVTVYAYLWDDDGDGLVEAGETVLVNTTVTAVNGDYAFTNLPSGGVGDLYIVSIAAPMPKLSLTTTDTSRPVDYLVETTNLLGETVSAYQAITIAPLIENMDFAFISLANYDYGDLPASYSTLLPYGARHVLNDTPDLYLGTSVDSESNGQPSASADLDNFDDGVAVSGIWLNGGAGTVAVEVGEGSGWLVGFIDFNQDGDLTDPGEMIVSQAVSSTGGPGSDGLYTLSAAIPADTLSTTNTTSLYSRFRLFPSQPLFPQLAYQGEAANGEVEDYRWLFHTISGTVYVDSSSPFNDFGSNDTPQPGVVIELYDASSNLLATTVTDLNGYYSFYGLPDGDYRIEMITPVGGNAILDVDGNTLNTFFQIDVTLAGASVDMQDFLLDGNASIASLSGTVWEDEGFGAPGLGTIDFGAPDAPVPGVIVSLYYDINTDGVADPNEFIGDTVTDGVGFYEFTDLPDGPYLVVMTTPNGSTSITDIDGIGNGTNLIQVTMNGTDQPGQDFLIDGAAEFVSLSGIAWFDENRNGIREDAEPTRFQNIPVALLDASSNVVATTTTDVDGFYEFTGIVPSTYFVRWNLATVNTNWLVTPANQGSDDTKDSDATSGEVPGLAYTDAIVLLTGQNQENVDVGIKPPGTTRASLSRVWGEWVGVGEVVFSTSAEVGTSGFFVYRVDGDSGEETRLNDVLLPASEEDGGTGVYRIADPLAEEEGSGTYRIEEIEFSGSLVNLGVHEVVFAEPAPVFEMAAPMLIESEPMLAEITAQASGPAEALKVFVSKDGVYGVGLQAIADGFGLSLAEVELLADSGLLAMDCLGQPVAYRVDSGLGALVFYGQRSRNWYTRDSVYWIRQAEGLTMPDRLAQPGPGASSFVVTERFEEDSFPLVTHPTRLADQFYWNSFVMGTAASVTRSYTVALPGYGGGDVALRVRLIGLTQSVFDPDHRAEFEFNGTGLGEVLFDGQEEVEVDLVVPAASVLAGDNVFTIRGTLQPGQTYGSRFVFDWVDATYLRTLAPSTRSILFAAGDAEGVSAPGFSSPIALGLVNPLVPEWIAGPSGTLESADWSVAAANEPFALVERSSVPLLNPVPGVVSNWVLDGENRVDYLVVTSRALQPAAQEIADYRASQGLRSGVAVFEDLCDLFAYGQVTPEAIRSLLAYARSNWAEAPWMVLLAGDGHYRYINNTSGVINHLPPMLVSTVGGLFAADGLIADVEGDDQIPDLAIGRLPARSLTELRTMLAKIQTYESDHGSTWNNRVVLAADVPDQAGDFNASSELLAEAVGEDPEVERIYLSLTPISDARAALLGQFNQGAGFVHYTGHGAPGNFSSRNLLTTTDADGMSNARVPVVIALTCLAGRFDQPTVHCLAEHLLRRNAAGAVAVWTASGFAYNEPSTELGEAFYRSMYSEGSGTLGLAILRALRDMDWGSPLANTFPLYNLLGDPATKLGPGFPGHRAADTFAQWRWERFAPDDLEDPEVSSADAVPAGSDAENFVLYAQGLNPGQSRPEGRGLWAYDPELGWVLNWTRLAKAKDVEYVILVSENLMGGWEENPGDLIEVDAALDAAGLLEAVRTRINRPEAETLFLDLQYRRK